MVGSAAPGADRGDHPVGRGPGVSRSARWSTLGLLFLASMLNLVDRQIVGILADRIKFDLSLTDTQLGLLTGTAFGLFYAFLTIPMSRLADHVSRTRLVAIAMFAWSAMTIACGLAADFRALMLARMGVGIGEAGSQPASASLIADLFPARQHGLAMAIFFLSVPIGGILGLNVGAFVGSATGWRSAFLVAGAPGLLLSVVVWIALRDPRPSAWARPDQGRGRRLGFGGIGHATRRLLAIRAYRLVVLGGIAGVSIQNVAAAWLPIYLVRVHGLSLREAASWISIALATGGLIGSLGSGWACDRLRKRFDQPESLVLTIALAAAAPTLVATCLATDRPSTLIGLIVTYFFVSAFLTPAILLAQKAAPDDLRGIAVGAMSSIMNVVSLTVVLPLVGFGSDVFTAIVGVRGLGYALACSALVAPAGAWVFVAAGRDLRRRQHDIGRTLVADAGAPAIRIPG